MIRLHLTDGTILAVEDLGFEEASTIHRGSAETFEGHARPYQATHVRFARVSVRTDKVIWVEDWS